MAAEQAQPMVSAQQMRPYRWVVLTLVVLTWITTFLIRLTWSPLIPVVVPILHMKVAQAGAYMSGFYFGYLINQVPALAKLV
jgi:hypothetical protein